MANFEGMKWKTVCLKKHTWASWMISNFTVVKIWKMTFCVVAPPPTPSFNDFMTIPVCTYDDSLPRVNSCPPFSKTNVWKPADCTESSCPTNPLGPLVTNQQLVQKHRFAAPAQTAKISVPFSQPKINYDDRGGRVNYDCGAAMHFYLCCHFDSVTVQAAPPSAQLFLFFHPFAGSYCKQSPGADSLLLFWFARNSENFQCFHDDE